MKIEQIRQVGQGLVRPEGVMADRQGTVYTADLRGHVNVISAGGCIRTLGQLGGRPNGICVDRNGSIIVANIGNGELQRVAVDGSHTVLAKVTSPNFPFVDRRARIWCSNSTSRADLQQALREALPDGAVFRIDGKYAEIVADNLVFANGLALDQEEESLYVAETMACRIARFRIPASGPCTGREQYGPWLGERGQPDGVAFDSAGNLWVTLVNDSAIGVIYPDETFEVVWRDKTLLKRPSNLCFGDPDLRTAYVGSLDGSTIPCFATPYPGMALIHQL